MTRRRLFIGGSWLAKATVQAALASAPLDLIVAQKQGDPEYAKWARWGQDIITTAVLSILVTAPVGLLFINYFGDKWLTCDPIRISASQSAPDFSGTCSDCRSVPYYIWTAAVALSKPRPGAPGRNSAYLQPALSTAAAVQACPERSALMLRGCKRASASMRSWQRIACTRSCPHLQALTATCFAFRAFLAQICTARGTRRACPRRTVAFAGGRARGLPRLWLKGPRQRQGALKARHRVAWPCC